MKVLYDHQIFESQNFGGISRYFAELIKFNPEAELSLKYSDNIYLQEEPFRKYRIHSIKKDYDNFIFPFYFKGKGRLYRYYNKILSKDNQSITNKRLKKSSFHFFHPTYYNPYFLDHLEGKPFILTVYDMIHELFPQYYLNDKVTTSNKKRLITQANAIIAISENTKKDILCFYPDLAEKIKVIYLGFSFYQSIYEPQKENYILFTGLRTGYKNFSAFVSAVAPLLVKYDLNLLCTGTPFYDEEKHLLDDLNISDRTRICRFVSDEELAKLYSKAIAFVFPSLYEGFGIPVLEAFASQCPAVLSNTSSLPEIGGDAAVYFDPHSTDDMRNKIERVICSSSLQDELIKKGKERLKQFSWEKCALETMEVYNSLNS
jgi:glycosyltransferase involved in cell wall biosynthesis